MRRMVATVLLVGAASTSALAGDQATCSPAGMEAYFPCSSCHGRDGEGNEAFGAPALAGQSEDYLAAQLRAFRAGRRGAHPMDPSGRQMAFLADSLQGEEEIGSVACYLSTLTPASRTPVVVGNLEAGASHYVACAACHGARAEGSPQLGAPALDRIQDWYQLAQLKAYREGWRGASGADPAAIQMRAAAMALPDEEAMRDVVAYIAAREGFSVLKDAIP